MRIVLKLKFLILERRKRGGLCLFFCFFLALGCLFFNMLVDIGVLGLYKTSKKAMAGRRCKAEALES